ncbi:hypothetical protein, partial [Methylomagnum sp.]
VVREFDLTGQFNDTAHQDPSLATPFSLTDEMVGQLHDTRDYDWFYVDVADSNHPVTPIYFGCDKKLGFYYEGPTEFKVDDINKDVYWQLEYYFDSDPKTPGGVERQSSYVVYAEACKRGLAETKGPMRFQMNTQRPGRYYVRVWGRLIATPVIVEDKIEINGEEKTRKTYYDEIVVPTADYSLRLYTARVGGELEPNDGMVEAYSLSSGVTVPAQLSSMYDQDWFFIDNDITKNTTKKLPFYFNCKGQTGKTYILSAYDYLGVLQSNYEVKAEQCNGSGGFSFTIDAPISNRYYFEVSSPTYTESDQFTQADYSVLVIAGPGTTTPDIPVRKDGDLEPNEKQVDAFPLPKNVGVTAQLSVNTDLDWFSIDYATDSTTTGVTTVSFECKGQASSGAVWELATYNPQNVPQASYTITAAQCAAASGFKFSLNTPTTGKYLLLVNAPATPTAGAFSQADYILRWAPITSDNSGTSGTVTRLPGELEPNETQVNAVPLTSTEAVIAQLAAVDDQDYYYVDNNASKNPTGTVPIYFGCAVADTSGVNYVLSYYNSKGLLQGNYTVNAANCSTLPKTTTDSTATTTTPATNGFKFDMKTPSTDRYYVLVSGPADRDAAKFSDADYSISTFLNVSSLISATNTGVLKTAAIVDMKAVNKDSFTINMAQCGKGVIRLAGNKLNLVGLDKNAQILVQIGKWSCLTSPAELTVNTSDSTKKTYVYPKPPTPATKPQTGISGGR